MRIKTKIKNTQRRHLGRDEKTRRANTIACEKS